jgi:predicted transcriptional regulator
MNAGKSKRTVLFSIRPFYVDKILAGQKTVELRRRFPEVGMSGSTAMIYSTSPVQAVVGSAEIQSVQKLRLSVLWKSHGSAACIAKDDFNEYFSGQDHGFAIMLTSPKSLKSCFTVSDLETEFGIIPPQSYRYLSDECVALLKDGRLQAPRRYKHRHSARRSAAR